jgi:hypothetical protein
MLILFIYKLNIIYYEEKKASQNARKREKGGKKKCDNLQDVYYKYIINSIELTL